MTATCRPAQLRSCAQDVGDTLGWNADRGVYLTREQADLCGEVFAETLEDLNSLISVPIPTPASLSDGEFKGRDFLPDVAMIVPADLRRFYDELGAMYSESRTSLTEDSAS